MKLGEFGEEWRRQIKTRQLLSKHNLKHVKGLENQNDNINMYSQIESGELLEENEDSVGN